MTLLNVAENIRSGAADVAAVYAGDEQTWPPEPPGSPELGLDAGPYVTEVLADQPYGYFRLADTAAAMANLGSAAAGSWSGTVQRNTGNLMPVHAGQSSTFDGQGYGLATAIITVGQQPFVLEAWIELEDLPPAGSFYTIVGLLGHSFWNFGVDPQGRLMVRASVAEVVLARSAITLEPGRPYHVAAAHRRRVGIPTYLSYCRVYVNGRNRSADPAVTYNQGGGSGRWVIGTHYAGGVQDAADRRFHGRIQEVAIFRDGDTTAAGALDNEAARIRAHYFGSYVA